MTPATLDPAAPAGAAAGDDHEHGFVVSAADYAEFRDQRAVRRTLADALHGLCVDDAGRLMAAALHARSLVRWAPWPDALRRRIEKAYAALVAETGESAVVVTCVATDDGLPGIVGEGHVVDDLHGLLGAIRRCWAALYTPQRVYERCTHGLSQVDVTTTLGVRPRPRAAAPSRRAGGSR